jgi:hypothetical protein
MHVPQPAAMGACLLRERQAAEEERDAHLRQAMAALRDSPLSAEAVVARILVARRPRAAEAVAGGSTRAEPKRPSYLAVWAVAPCAPARTRRVPRHDLRHSYR